MSEFETRKFKCTGCGEARPCYLEVTEQQFYDNNMINNLKCVVDDTNSTGFNWEEVQANGVTTGEKQCNLPVVSKQSEPFRCFEIHYPNIPANGCTVQCKECAEKEKQLNGC